LRREKGMDKIICKFIVPFRSGEAEMFSVLALQGMNFNTNEGKPDSFFMKIRASSHVIVYHLVYNPN
jgi:hypothetical protein